MYSGGKPENIAKTKNHGAYTDPWMDYVAASSQEELVNSLVKSSNLRETLQRKLEALGDGSSTPDPALLEKKEFYLKALSEAQSLLLQGPVEGLAPLDSSEAFSMDIDENDREIKRLLASMAGTLVNSGGALSHQDDGLHYALFPRVHRALWRQIANGNIQLKSNVR